MLQERTSTRIRQESRTAVLLPLSKNERDLGASLAVRLKGEITQLSERLGPDGKSPRALARRIGVDFAVCQRVLSAINSSGTELEVLQRLPGVVGLRSVVQGMMAAAEIATERHPALRVVDEFEKFVRDAGSSRAQLIRRINLTNPPPMVEVFDEDRSLAARRSAFDALVEYNRTSVDLTFVLNIMRPMQGRPGMLETVSVQGLVGLRCALPRLIHVQRMSHIRHTITDLVKEAVIEPITRRPGASPHDLIDEFSTVSTSVVSAERIDGRLRTVFDLSAAPGTSFDIVSGRRWSPVGDPRMAESRRWSQFLRTRYPSRRGLIDYYLHRSLTPGMVPETGAALTTPNLSPDPAQNWDCRLPDKTRLEVLGRGLDGASTKAWSRHAELSAWLFKTVGWNPDEFIGYRVEELYPLWGATYMLSFHYPQDPYAE